jgi:hypothetical protein
VCRKREREKGAEKENEGACVEKCFGEGWVPKGKPTVMEHNVKFHPNKF